MTTRLFTSWVRRGLAAGIAEPDPGSGPYPGPADFQPAITLARDGTAQASSLPGPNLPVLGPGAIVGIDLGAVVRTDPAPGATGVEDNHLALAELARPDLSWLFTPAKPNSANRLRPWLVLVVVDASTVALEPGTPLPRITVNDSELPDLNDSWAWAHAQVTVDDPTTAQQALVPPSGGSAISRLLCPRRLAPDTAYLACLVPSTLVGVQAGLGLPLDPGPALALAWTAGAGQDVVLPVFYSWTFSTGDNGDFKSLVQRLVGVKAVSITGFGTRTIDMSTPWESPPQLGDGMTIELDGALGIGVDRPGTLTDAARSAFETRLTSLLNFPASLQPTNATGDPTLSAVAPPIYGGTHAGAAQVPSADGWLRQLNLDPRRRIAAAFGTRYVQDHQEFLMARAWDQLGAVQAANRLRALAELAAEVADRLHARHIQTLGPSELLSVAAPARTRVLVSQAATLQATAASTPLPPGAGTVAFRRFSRPLGPIGRRAFARATPTVIEQGLSGAVQAAPPPVALDGIAALAVAPGPGQLTADATGSMVARAWQAITATEQTIQVPPNLSQVRQALNNAVGSRAGGFGFGSGTPGLVGTSPPTNPLSAPSLAATVAAALLPSSRIVKRLDGRILVPGNLGGGNTTVPVMACPEFKAPLAMALLQDHLDYLLPGLGNFPDDHVTLLSANAAFVEAFLTGANHEMNRELLWREYPTDRRGTPFRYFWPRPDGNADIPPITAWPITTALGQNGAGNGLDPANMIVLLVRGEVLRRYPRTIVFAAPGRIDGNSLTLDTSAPWTAPQFLLRLGATTTAFAYPLTAAQVHSDLSNGVAGWYFVFSEPVTGPRFKFGATASGSLQRWTDLDWDHVPQSRGFAIAGLDLAPPSQETAPTSPRWNNDAADMGRIAFARPFRVGYHADELLSGV
jgi:hypothetical protein